MNPTAKMNAGNSVGKNMHKKGEETEVETGRGKSTEIPLWEFVPYFDGRIPMPVGLRQKLRSGQIKMTVTNLINMSVSYVPYGQAKKTALGLYL